MNAHDLPPDASVLQRMVHLRKTAGAVVVDGFFRGITRAGRWHPMASPHRHGVEVLSNIPYLDSGRDDHLLDVYRPVDTGRFPRPLPVVLYLHGGGFRILSKDTHWLMGLAFARRGYLVLNCSYRLAPRHPFPAAVEDAVGALVWLKAHAREYGGDPSRVVFAGESAGANLATTLALTTCYQRPEPFAAAAWETGIVPRAVVAACGIFQVSDPERFSRHRPVPWWVADRVREVTDAYLHGLERDGRGPCGLDLADPLVTLERAVPPDRALPPFFLPVGTKDLLQDDTRRLKAALDALGVPADARYYPGESHAFHAFVWRKAAQQCWQDTFGFLDAALRPGQETAPAGGS